MTRSQKLAALLCPCLALAPLSACAAVLGVEDGVLVTASLRIDGGGETSGPDALAPPMIDAGPDVVTVKVPDTCPMEQADETHGIFVSLGGVGTNDGGTSTCGSKALPCNSVGLGITRARSVAGTTMVYVDSGTYHESVALLGGLTVQGGWDDVGGVWRRQCFATRDASVLISATSNVGVRAIALDSMAVLDTLSISSRPSVTTAGPSFYGVVATGASTWLRLQDVVVTVGDAAPGASGAAGGAGENGFYCVAGGGGPGAPGTIGSGAGPGTFDVSGYRPTQGLDGVGGAPGAGTSPGAGQCGTCVPCDDYPTCGNGAFTACGNASGPGCGGGGGIAGSGGNGGGSSIALFAWQAQVDVVGGGLQAGSGGNGGAGGVGGAGGAPTTGVTGASYPTCVVSCSPDPNNSSCDNNGQESFPGGVGTTGGTGGAGGAGGGGAGGNAFAIYKGGSALVDPSGTVIAIGTAGTGGMSPGGVAGAAGKAAQVGP